MSCTAEFDPEREHREITGQLSEYEDRLKGIVFLPASGHGYAQPPYEAISEAHYTRLMSRLRPLAGVLEHERALEAAFCEGGACDIE